MKRKITLIVIAVLIINTFILLIYHSSYDQKTILEDNQKTIDTTNNTENMVSIMLETSAGSGKYTKSSSNSFPTSGYVFNSSKSGCENGGTLDYADGKLQLKNNISDKCYVYFDRVLTLATYIKGLYTTQGSNGLYYHDASLANGAGDNSYRYSGANPDNYVCFGSNESPCPTDNLYRIIGVFGDKVKLIKSDYANSNLLGTDGDYSGSETPDASNYKGSLTTVNTYKWNYKNNTSINSGNGSNTWSTSLLNKTNLNTNFITNIGTEWANKIATTTWKVGGNTYENISKVVPATAYQKEIVNPVTTNTTDNATEYPAKIGLMYVSDYGFAADPSAWTTTLYDYDGNINGSKIRSLNWMHMGGYTECPISRSSGTAYYVFNVYAAGFVNNIYASDAYVVRPSFSLESSVTYASGDGTASSPIRIG